MKALWNFLLAALACVPAAILLACCGPSASESGENGHVHDYGEWVVYKEATCEEIGYMSRICGCGSSETQTIEALGHDFKERVISEPTCEERGQSEFVCRRDPSHHYLKTVEALGHDWQESGNYIAPTCTQAGYSDSAICERCGDTREKQTLPALGHDYSGKTEEKPAACETNGEITTYCVRECGAYKTEIVEALGHDFGPEETVRDATCTAPGETQRTCARCQKKVKTTVEALGHDWETGDVIKPATCTDPGLSASAVCKRCNAAQGETVIPALGHDFTGSTFYRSQPTCTKTGSAYKQCRRNGCQYQEDVVLPTVPHEYTQLKSTDELPTCTEDGIEIYVCHWCGQETEPKKVEALGHDWKEIKIVKPATCTENGKIEHYCLRCKVTQQDPIPALGHRFEDYRVAKAATATEKGVKTPYCIRCGADGTPEDMDFLPDSAQNVQYEIRLRRPVGLEYKGANEVTFEVDCGDETRTFTASGVTTTVSLPGSATKLTVKGIRDGFEADRASYDLNPSNPFVTILLSAKVRTDTRIESGGQKSVKNPDTLIDEGDPLFDFVVIDTKHADDHTKDQWLSEVIQGKKLVMFDFFWIGCTSCATLMQNFLAVYNQMLQPYKEDILVVMVDVMKDETDEQIEAFRKSKEYPEEFLICHGKPDPKIDFLHWFEREGRGSIPMCIFVDGEGVVYKIGGVYSQDSFRKVYSEFFASYIAPEEISKKTAAEAPECLPVSLCDPDKRRFARS